MHGSGKRILLPMILFVIIAAAASGEDWPQFAGPHGNCVSQDEGIITEWPEGGPPVKWRIPLNPGFGAPCVKDGEIFILDREVGVEDRLRCLDLETGKELWRFKHPAPGKISHPGSRSQPAVDDEHVYFVNPFGDFFCIDRKTHEPRWRVNILDQYDGDVPRWAVSQSPALYKNRVIVAPVGSKAGLVAYDRMKGKPLWISKPFPGRMTYCSPLISTFGGKDQVLLITTEIILGVDAETGKLLWSHDDWKCRIPITSPTHLGDGRIFVTGGYGAGVILFEVKRKGGAFEARTLFKSRESNGQIQQPLVIGKHLYMNGNDKGKRDGFVCMDFEGRVKWKTGKSPGFDWGGLLYAGGHIFSVEGTSGDLCMLRPDPEKYLEVARMPLLKGEEIWAPIVLSRGRLLCRDQSQLVCVDLRKK